MANVSSSNSQGVHVPKLRFPGFEGEWEESVFSEAFTFLGNNTLSRAELSDVGEIKNIHYGDVLIKFGEVINADDAMIPRVKDAESLKKTVDYLQTGDVIIADTAEDDSVGKATELLNPENTAVVSGLHTIPCRPNYAFASSYLGYYINSKAFHNQLYPFMQGIKVTSISKGNIGKVLISYPRLSEQKKIADLLMLLSGRIEKQRQLVEALKSYKRGALSKLFPQKGETAPKYRFAGFTEPWEQRKISEIANRYDNLRVPVAASLRIPGTTPYYGANGIQDYVEGYTHNGEFVLVAEDGANDLKNYPVKCVNGRIWVNNHAHVLQAQPQIADNQFLAYSINQADIGSHLVGGGRAKLNAETLMDIELTIPNIEEQRAIGNYLQHFDSLITLHQRELDELQIVKAGLLQVLFI